MLYNRTLLLIYFKYSSVCSGEGSGTPLQYSCLENPMDGGAWWAAVHWVAKNRTRLSDFTFTFHFHALKKEMATHSSVLAWRIPGTGEPGGLPSMGLHRVGHDWSDLAAAVSVQPILLTYPTSSPVPFGNYKFIFYVWVYFHSVNKFICIFFVFFLDSMYKWFHVVFIFLWLTSLSMIISRSIHVAANGIISFFFYGIANIL